MTFIYRPYFEVLSNPKLKRRTFFDRDPSLCVHISLTSFDVVKQGKKSFLPASIRRTSNANRAINTYY